MTILDNSGFEEYRRRVFRYYEEKKYAEALREAREASERFPEYDSKTSFWIACLHSRLGNHDEAVQALESATKRGVWWREDTLRDHDLDPIRDWPEFRTILEACRRLQLQAPKTAQPALMIRTPKDYTAQHTWPAVMAFHARYGERPEISMQEWFSITSSGMILASPWSSQVYAPDGRCWDDLDVAEKDVKWAFSELSNRYRVDSKKLVLGGFSQGAALSIFSVLKRLTPCTGFVAVASSDWVRPEEKSATERRELSQAFESFVRASDCRGLRGAVIIGDEDAFFPKIERLYSLMVERGLDGRFLVEPGVGHEYPHGFGMMLRDAVNFVLTGA